MFISLMEHFVTVKEEQTTFAGDFYFYLLTLFVARSNICVKWRGRAFSTPLMFSKEMAFFGSKNYKTTLPYILEDLTEGLEHMRHPQPPKKSTF